MKDIEKVISTLNAKGLFGEIKVIESLLKELEAAEKDASIILRSKADLIRKLEATERKLAEDTINQQFKDIGKHDENCSCYFCNPII